MSVLVLGCGDVGGRVAREMVARGNEVRGVRRSDGPMPDGVTAVRADLATGRGLDRLPRTADLVVYTAAAGRMDEAGYRATYVDGPRRALARLDHVGRLVFASSTSVYGQRNGEWVDEESATEPPGFAGRVMLEAEAAIASSGVPATLVRFGGIYGPGREYLIRLVREGRAIYDEHPPRWTNRIHAEDAARAIVHLACDVDRPPDIVTAVDDAPVPRAEVFRWLAARLGVDPSPPATPPPSRPGNKRCANGRLRSTGFAFRYPTYREGYTALLGD